MSQNPEINKFLDDRYEAGFVTNIESDTLPPGLSEDVIRTISARKGEPEWLLEWRLEAYKRWQQMKHPEWAHLDHPPVDFNEVSYFSHPKSMKDTGGWSRCAHSGSFI